ncbi:MAG: ADOP family duplicated permease [Acidobacteriota bacterium]
MRPLRAFFHRLRGLFGNASGDVDAELESHLQMHIDDGVRAGLSAEEARRQALIRLGGLEQTRQAMRERRTLPWAETLAQDLRFALRQLRKAPGFTAVVIATLALGIGVNTALFSIVNTVLLHPIDLPRPNELLAVDASKPNFEHGSISYPNFRDWQRDNRSFSGLAVYHHVGFVMTGSGESERVRGNYVSSSFFPVLGIRPVIGRVFASDEDEIGRAPLVVLGGGFWERKFGADPRIVGRAITLDNRTYTVVGVIPASFDLAFGGFLPEDIYIPIGQWNNNALERRGAGLGIHGIARLKPGVTLAQAQADMNNVADHLAAVYPEDDHGLRASLQPLRTAVVGDLQPVLLILLVAVGFVLLIACSNVANLLLARSTARAQEFGVRLALGAGRRRIVRQVLTESLLLALAGGALGLGLAAAGVRAAVSLVPEALPRASHIQLSASVLGFTFAISVLVGILFGLIPAWRVAGQQPQSALREGGRTVHGSRHRTQDGLVILQMAAALVLLSGSGLMLRSLFALTHTSPGFDPNGVLRFSVAAPAIPVLSTPEGARSWIRRLHDQMEHVPGVQAVSLVSDGGIPLTGDDDEELFWLQNEAKPANNNDMHWSLLYIVDTDYLRVMRIPLVRGRFFSEADRQDAPHVAVIDEDLARQYFGSGDPIGKVINITNPTDDKVTVVGVVGHVLQWGLDNDAGFPLHAQLYLPASQYDSLLLDASQVGPNTGFFYDVLARADHPAAIFPDLRTAVQRMNAAQVAWRPLTMNEIIDGSLAERRFSMLLLGAFAGLALLLASVGLYGVISYLVGQRTQEMAIRMALGADRSDVLRWVLRRGALLAALGIGAGTVAALAVTRVMAGIPVAKSSILYGVRPWDPVTLAGVIAVLLLVALLASYVPARRAASVDPMRALRSE